MIRPRCQNPLMLWKAKVYVETSVLSRLLDYQRSGKMRLKENDIGALEALSERADVQLVTSEKTLEEFRNTQAREHRIALTLVYRLIAKVSAAPLFVPIPSTVMAISGRSRIVGPPAMPDSELAELEQIFDSDDAEHILHASRSGCTHFLTVDTNTILNRVRGKWSGTAAARGGMLIVSPTELMSQLGRADDESAWIA